MTPQTVVADDILRYVYRETTSREDRIIRRLLTDEPHHELTRLFYDLADMRGQLSEVFHRFSPQRLDTKTILRAAGRQEVIPTTR